jgi:hypothetical protein
MRAHHHQTEVVMVECEMVFELVDVFFTGAIINDIISFNPINKNILCGFAYKMYENDLGRFYTRTFTATLPFEKIKDLKVNQKIMLDKSFL